MIEVTEQELQEALNNIRAFANKCSKWSKTKTKQNDFVDIDFLNESGEVVESTKARFKNTVETAWNYTSENTHIAEVKIHLIGGNNVGFKSVFYILANQDKAV